MINAMIKIQWLLFIGMMLISLIVALIVKLIEKINKVITQYKHLDSENKKIFRIKKIESVLTVLEYIGAIFYLIYIPRSIENKMIIYIVPIFIIWMIILYKLRNFIVKHK